MADTQGRQSSDRFCKEKYTKPVQEGNSEYLRLDGDGSPDPVRTLTYYRDNGQLRAIKVGRKNRYRRWDLEKFLAEKSEGRP